MLRKSFEGDRRIRGKQLATMAVLGTALSVGTLGGAAIASAAENSTILVSTVDELYDAVNNGPAGAWILLAPGVYTLSASVTDTNGNTVARPNGGRLELQTDMSLVGVEGDRAAVMIDATGLQSSSFTTGLPSSQRTGVIRAGRGTNTIEWLTVLGKVWAAAGIEMELPGTLSTHVRVAHVVSGGTSRGVDVRNAGFANFDPDTNTGRRLDAEIVDNEFIGPDPAEVTASVTTEGIRVINFAGANNSVVTATLSGNQSHGFQYGCVVANNRSSNAVVHVQSSGDRFFANAQACVIFGAIVQTSTAVANSNSTKFEGYGSAFVDNTLTIGSVRPGGVRVVGGLSSVSTAGPTSQNMVSVALWDSTVSGNAGIDFQAFGAWSGTSAVAGTDNHATVRLYGTSAQIDVVAADSVPFDPGGTNTVAVIRIRTPKPEQ